MPGRKVYLFAAAIGASMFAGTAAADVRERCRNAVCGRSTYDGTRVNIYMRHQLTRFTHYNFRTNPGAQIELRQGHYSFATRRGRRGTYSVQACARGGLGQRSLCTGWATFDWNASN